VRGRYFREGWNADVEAAVKGCLGCEMERMRKPGRQGKLVKYHPTRRFELVATDVLEMTPPTVRGHKKVLVIGDMFTRYIVAVAIKNDTADTVARMLLTRWLAIFGPPERLLSDRGPNFAGDVIARLCELVGTKKGFTTSYHPQTNGFIERYNRTLSAAFRKNLIDEENWYEIFPLVTFQHNASQHSATKITPFRAMFGTEPFEFDCGLQLRFRADDEPTQLAARLREIHTQLLRRGIQSREIASRVHDSAVQEVEFPEGGRVLVYDEPTAAGQGRKMRVPWMGPYRVEKRLSPVGYLLRAESDGRTARVHANRIRAVRPGVNESPRDPQAGMWPDSRRMLRSILERREVGGVVEYRVPRVGRRGYAWLSEHDLPEVVVRAYELFRTNERSAAGADVRR
jgi:Integrase core domain